MAHASFLPLAAGLVLMLAACSGERRDWRSAEAADTVEAYDQFITRHPESELAAQARERLAQLAEDREWQRASTANTPESYRAFLAQHPNGKWAGEARIRVESFTLGGPAEPATAQPFNGYGIQLGAFSSEAAALEEWDRLRSRHPSQLGTLISHVERAGSVYRLQAGVGAEEHARAVCGELTRASQPCVVVLPPR